MSFGICSMIDLSDFFNLQAGLLRRTPKKVNRFLFEQIDWQSRLVGIAGARGVGKTTMILQYLAQQGGGSQKHLYISADHIRVEALGLYEIATSFFQTGGTLLVIDEVHKYMNWAQELKNLYDFFPDARIIFSGSSTLELQLGKADLSRRAVYYSLPVLSFREYLMLTTDRTYAPLSLAEILDNHTSHATSILEDGQILGLFSEYLKQGVYPFFLEGQAVYQQKLLHVVEKVLFEDIPSATGMRFSGIPILKKILYEVATSLPFELNIDRMANNFGVSRPTVYSYLDHLERAGLLIRVLPEGAGATLTRKPAKLFLENTNLLRAVGQELDPADPLGTVRENFFVNQCRGAALQVRGARKADFWVEGNVFEVGGRNKSQRQIRGEPNGYVVRDSVEVGFANVIPLWLFGFLY